MRTRTAGSLLFLVLCVLALGRNVTIVNPTNKPVPIKVAGVSSDGSPIGPLASPSPSPTPSPTPTPTAFNPSTIAGLQVWFKADAITPVADGTQITTWPDSSSNGNNATAAAGQGPVYYANQLRAATARIAQEKLEKNKKDARGGGKVEGRLEKIIESPEQRLVNKPALIYPGGVGLNLTSPVAVNGTAFAVLQNSIYYELNGLTSNNGALSCSLRSPSGPTYTYTAIGGATAYWGDQTLSPANWYVVTNITPGGPVVIWINGNPYPVPYGALQKDGSPFNAVGSVYGAAGNRGTLAEVLKYSGVLSDLDRMKVQEYLGTKYGLPVPPAGNYAGAAVVDQHYDGLTTNDNMNGAGSRRGVAQTFISTGGKIKSSSWPWYRFAGSSGPAYSRLYRNNGGVPGQLLATSDPLDVATLPASTTTGLFNFSEQYFLIAGQEYFISQEYNGPDGILISIDTSNGHSGVGATYNGTGWAASTDFPFSVSVIKP
jgi:hypothetical protein